MRIPFVDLKAQYESIKEEIDKAISNVILDSAFVGGKYIKLFERNYANYLGTKHCIGVGNGTDALFIVLKTLGIGEGDEVISAANTFIATSEAITMTGAKVVFVDCDNNTYNIDVKKIEKAIANKTKAIIPVHLYGQPADMDPIIEIAQKYNLYIVEDCAQAHGAVYKGRKAGAIAPIACFSFFPSKNFGAYGDGGMIVTNDEELSQKAKMLRDYGQAKKYHHELQGQNSRLDSIQAAVLLAKLPHLDTWNDNRRKSAQLYNELLSDVEVTTPVEGEGYRHIYHLYVIRTKKRDEMLEYLKTKDVFCGIHYPIPIHLQNAYKDLPYKKGDFPITEEYADEILSLPMYPELTEEQIHYVVDRTEEFISKD